MVRKIVIAVDSSDQAEAAFKYYAKNLHKSDSDVTLLHCPELSNVGLRMAKGEKPPYSSFQKKWEEELEEQRILEEKFNKLASDSQVVTTFKVEPTTKAGESIVSEAEKVGADMIVMGTRGLGTIRRTIMGSVSDYVVHNACCTVVVYRTS